VPLDNWRKIAITLIDGGPPGVSLLDKASPSAREYLPK
jgi:hypothetical protein